MQNSKRMLFAVAITLLSSCSERSNITVINQNDFRTPADATRIEAQVTTDSGATLSLGNKLQLTIPAGALSEDALISMETKSTAPVQNEVVPIASSIELGGHGIEFNKPVTLNACYDPAKLVQNNLHEDTVAVYYVDPQTGEYASLAGSVNKSTHCISAQLEHFSVYLIAAQGLSLANSAPQISAATYLPSTAMAGLPLKIRSVIRDFQNVTVNGQVGFGQVASATLYYRIPGEPSFTAVPLTPDYLDDTATRFVYKIPANRVTTAGIEYYISATDNLGAPRTRAPVTLAIARTAAGLAFQANPVVDLSAGFKRSYTVRGIDDLGTARNIDVDSFSLSNGIGTAIKTTASVVQVTGTTTDNQNYRIGNLTVNAGPYSITSADIRVHAGVLDHMSFLSPKGVKILNQIDIGASSTYDFTVLGYDEFGNSTNVLPLLALSPSSGTGTISGSGIYNAPAAPQTLVLSAALAGQLAAISINILPNDSFAWIKGMTSGDSATAFYGIISDNSDHFITFGNISGGWGTSATFGPGIILANPKQSGQAFLSKYDFLGNAIWSKYVFGTVEAIIADSTNNIYNVMNLGGPPTGGQSSYIISPSVTISGIVNGNNATIIKYDSMGNAIWARMATTPTSTGFSSFYGIAKDNADNVFAVGMQSMNAFFSYGPGVDLPALSPGANNGFVLVKYDPMGNAIWAVRQQAPGCTAISRSVATDTLGNIYIVGYIYGSGMCDFGSAITISGNDSNGVPLIVKYDPSGSAVWAKVASSGSNASSQSDHGEFHRVQIDGSNNLYVTGIQYGTKTIDYGNGVMVTGSYASGISGDANGTLLKYDNTGNAQWGRTALSGADRHYFGNMAIDSAGNTYVTAYQAGTGLYVYGAGVSFSGTVATPYSNNLLLKYDTNGNVLWAHGPTSGAYSSYFMGIALDLAGQIIIAGYKTNNELVPYGPGITFAGSSLGQNAFLMRYLP